MNHAKQHPFFVYGTLLPEQPNAYLWAGAVVQEVRAALPNGRLYDCGFFPMCIEEGGAPVQGVLIEIVSEQYESVLAHFDRLEGVDPKRPLAGAYRRVVRGVLTDNGRLENAWVYVGQKQFVAGLPIIKSGDWLAHMETKQTTVDDWWYNIDRTPE
ncbi:MAG: gamma-glutamylcyclotransferase family protein [Chloroflexota bacterium]